MIKVYNTLTKHEEELIPREPGKIRMYVCGPTVYNYIHIGNARAYIVFDVIRRYLIYRGYQVTYVQNFTDIDDKIINRAKEENIPPEEVAAKYTQAFIEDAAKLGLKKADISPKATEHIPEMLEVINGLIEKGLAYEVDGDVFFEVTKFKGYGKLSGRTLEEMRAGERVEVDERKHHPMDFALWKAAKPDEPSWDSPWGKGRPGWHIECSAMSSKYLGYGFDIHGGGQDLIFPHHENEIAQAEGFTGKEPFVRYWLHNGFVNIESEKMAKSVGNIIVLRELLGKYSANALRAFFLSTHYRSPIDYYQDKLEEAGRAVERLETLLFNIDYFVKGEAAEAASSGEEKKLDAAISEAKKGFEQAMDNDFNTPQALAAIFKLSREANIFMEDHWGKASQKALDLLVEARRLLVQLTGVLGLELKTEAPHDLGLLSSYENRERLIAAMEKFSGNLADAEKDRFFRDPYSLIEALLKAREEARSVKNWPLADEIRDKLAEAGVEIEDTPQGARWKAKKV